ncbi:MAG: ATP-binding protein [Planctomycetota bacterium]|nr:ATP-binding protein [Planctomycetota bacterium]
MTYQFLKFYLGVLAILAVAWLVQAFNAQQIQDENFKVVQDTFKGQVRLVNYLVSKTEASGRRELVEQRLSLQKEGRGGLFKFKMRYVPPDEPRVLEAKAELKQELNFYEVKDGPPEWRGLHVISELSTKDGYVDFGPLPELQSPSFSAQAFGLSIVLFLSAIAIALLLRPLVNQLSLVEKTAMAIADGNLSARINEKKAGSAREMAQAFNFMAEKTDKLLASHRQLLQCVSHELRTPISKLRFGIDLIRDAENDRDIGVRVNNMEAATDELEKLINELLSYVKLDSVGADLHLEDCNLKEISERQFEVYQSMFPNIEFSFSDAAADRETVWHADRIMLERVIANLIGNAGRFARSKVKVTSCLLEGIPGLVVEDDGCGIPEIDREKVFEPFCGIHEERSDTGLGLTIVRKIVENHDSVVGIQESKFGGCSVFIQWHQKSKIQSMGS